MYLFSFLQFIPHELIAKEKWSPNKGTKKLAGNIFINEIIASNDNPANVDEFGDKDDWIELYNNNSFPVNIGGYYITDKLSNPTLYQIPTTDPSKTTIPAKGYLILWADEEMTEGILHVNCKLGAGGEQVGLYKNESGQLVVVDTITFGPQTANVSYGRYPDGSATLTYLSSVTQGSANQNSGGGGTGATLSPPQFSSQGGFYTSSFFLTLTTSTSGAVIRYTTDGSEPTASSPVYSSPILIKSRVGDPNKISLIRTTVPDPEPQTAPNDAWYPPNGEVFKITVIRAKVFKTGSTPSASVTNSYLIDPAINSRYSFPVISLSIDEANLFSGDKGIYVSGDNYDGSNWTTANFALEGEAWERPVHIELFEPGGALGFKQNAGIRIHGNVSTRNRIKSLRMYAKSSYGPDFFNYKLLPQKNVNQYKRFILRNSGQDFNGCYFKDAMMHKVVQPLSGMTIQEYRASIVFINGEYWGIHNIRDRIDKYYYSTNYNIKDDSIDVLENNYLVSDGDNTHYLNMLNYIRNNNMSDNNKFAVVKTMMDTDNYADYYVAEIIMNNIDWPQNNIKFWRKKTASYQPNAPFGHDGRWRWTVYDTDAAFRDVTRDNLTRSLRPNEWSTQMAILLLNNAEYKREFINRFADQLNTIFKPERVQKIITDFQTPLAPAMQEHIDRWKAPGSIANWNGWCNTYKEYASQRPAYVYSHVQAYFSLPGTANVTLNVSDMDAGNIKISTVLINENTPGVTGDPYPWTGKYFKGNPVVITAIAKSGYKFVKWSNNSTSESITVTFTGDATYTAIFEPTGPVVIKPTPFDLSTGNYTMNAWPTASAAATYPANMLFVKAADDVQDPGLATTMSQDYTAVYNATSKTRMNGLDADGFSFINTGSGGNLGAAIVALKTTGRTSITAQWKAGTIVPNVRVYALRLQYKVGNGSWKNFSGNVEYLKNDTAGHLKSFDVNLSQLSSNEVDNKSLVYLRWVYYYVSGDDGARPQIRLDDILISSTPLSSEITANAGADKNIPYTQTSILLQGTGTGSISSYQWTQLNGPTSATLTNANTANVTVSNLQIGTYNFRLTVKNSSNVSVTDDVKVVVEGPAVVSFTLINADTDQDIKTLLNNDVINLGNLPTKNLNIRANANPAVVGSIVFTIDGANRSESTAPYSLYGDNNGDYSKWTPSLGQHTLVAKAYTSAGGKGSVGTPLTINFSVTNEIFNQLPLVDAGASQNIVLPNNQATITGTASDPDGQITSYVWTKTSGPAATLANANTLSLSLSGLAQGTYVFRLTVKDNGGATSYDEVTINVLPQQQAPASIVSFTLINADTDADIRTIVNGETINLSLLPTKKINIRINSNPGAVASIQMNLNGTIKTEKTIPYSLKGDNNGDYASWTPTNGNYTLTATPYVSAPSGTIAGQSLTVNFTVVDNLGFAAKTLVEDSTNNDLTIAQLNAYPNPFSDIVNIEYSSTKSEEISIEVYNSRGKLLTTLYSGAAVENTVYRFEFDGRKLKEPIYYVRLTTKDRVVNQTLIMAK